MGYNALYRKWVLIFAIVIGIGSFGGKALKDTDSNLEIKMAPKVMDFNFELENEDDLKLSLVDTTTDNAEIERSEIQLDATIINTGKTVLISGVEAFAMSELLGGETEINIDYRVVASDKTELQQTLEVNQELGIIPLQLSKENPYWRISNKNGQWGVGNTESGIPSVLYDLLPKNVRDLKGYNNISSYKSGVAFGTVRIKQFLPSKNKIPQIMLSSLGLTEELNQKVIAGDELSSSLEIMANYSFEVSFALEQDDQMQIQGEITLRTYADVVHDIKP